MRKKHWLIGLLGVAALVLGLGSATVLAQESEGETSPLSIFARMANILGLDEQDVQDAYEQARQEMLNEQFEERIGQQLDALVESGRITQEQADELRAWYAERPESFWLAGGKSKGWDRSFRHSGRGYSAKSMFGMAPAMVEERLTEHLAALVEDGTLTQEQADQLREQYGAHLQQFQKRGFDRGRGFMWQRSRGPSLERGYFFMRSYPSIKDGTAPATPATAPDDAAAPTATPDDPATPTPEPDA